MPTHVHLLLYPLQKVYMSMIQQSIKGKMSYRGQNWLKILKIGNGHRSGQKVSGRFAAG